MKDLATPIYEELKEKIITNAYFGYETLTELGLSAQFNVSRNTAKKVLMMLESDGLVVIEKNKSARINSRSLEEVSGLLELREVMEGYIVKNAVAFITDEQVARLEAILQEMKQQIDNRELLTYIHLDRQFHAVIFDACNNPTAVRMTMQVKNLFRRYGAKTILVPGRDQSSYDEHIAIYEAVKRRDAEEARIAMQLHIANLKKTFDENTELLL